MVGELYAIGFGYMSSYVLAVCNFFNDVLESSAGFRLQIVDDEEVKSIAGDLVITT